MNRYLLAAAFACLLLVGGAGTAVAATADFQCNCSFTQPNFCLCDASRQSSFGPGTSCGAASVVQYAFDFRDGTVVFTSNPLVAHQYFGPICEGDWTSVAVFCSDGSSATRTHCYCNVVGINGCIRPGAGWTP